MTMIRVILAAACCLLCAAASAQTPIPNGLSGPGGTETFTSSPALPNLSTPGSFPGPITGPAGPGAGRTPPPPVHKAPRIKR